MDPREAPEDVLVDDMLDDEADTDSDTLEEDEVLRRWEGDDS